MQWVEEAIMAGGKACDTALVVAFNHGWDVMGGLGGAAFASSEVEQKELQAAIKAAEIAKKMSKLACGGMHPHAWSSTSGKSAGMSNARGNGGGGGGAGTRGIVGAQAP
ncbi:hypothetical protein Vretimale_12773 [Volvox reticuliferus]|uniref:Uncharacterized protein n=1 Tax=Volvox reticuliferus TaxID=1737510 RepID=A0A8J4CEX9_9CHLO|nr:hypothetical protein Vretifemale_10060 [Volvox reticuliferus]GIM08774.1 hypothetical protein Vretimale_12773 [Volvox reticuliferus]